MTTNIELRDDAAFSGAPDSALVFTPRPGDIMFNVAGGKEVIRITSDGRLVRGPAFMTDDEASMALFDVMSECLIAWMSQLRQRAESAEAELAALKHPF